MPFTKKIKEDVLVACGRCCSLCHKFCGIKIEVHHIQEVTDGGDNSFENAIPLCFDCHGDMRSYDNKHPKGNNYTKTELKKHRDNWYEKIKGNIGIADRQSIVETDKKVFQALVNILPWNRSLNFLKHNDFGGFFKLSKLDDLHAYEYKSNDPAFEFIDPDLEALRARLLDEISDFNLLVGYNTIPTHNVGFNSIDKELKLEDPKAFHKLVSEFNSKAEDIVNTYSTLIKTATRKLGELPSTFDDSKI
jgi:hypothetical protein